MLAGLGRKDPVMLAGLDRKDPARQCRTVHKGQVMSVSSRVLQVSCPRLRRQPGRATGFPGRKALGADSANSGKEQWLGLCGLRGLKLKEVKTDLWRTEGELG